MNIRFCSIEHQKLVSLSELFLICTYRLTTTAIF